jgi:hypothetical protein
MSIKINRDGVELGQWPENEIREFYAEGRLVDSDLFWREGMSTWEPLSRFVRPPPPFPKRITDESLAKEAEGFNSQSPTASIKLHNHNVRGVTLSLDNRRLFFLCGESLCSWDLESESYETLVDELPQSTEYFLELVPDGSSILLFDKEGHLHSFDFKDRSFQLLGELMAPPEGATCCFRLAPDGRHAVVCGFKRTTMHGHSDVGLRIWDLQTLNPVIELKGHSNPVCDAHFFADGSRLITCSGFVGDHGFFGCEPSRYRIWRVNDGVCLNSFGGEKRSVDGEETSEPNDQLSSGCLGVSADWKIGLFLQGQQPALVDLPTWKTERLFHEVLTAQEGDESELSRLRREAGLSPAGGPRMVGAQLSADGNYVFALNEAQVFHAWSRTTGAVEFALRGQSAYANDFTVTKNNRYLITTHSDGGYGKWIYRRELGPIANFSNPVSVSTRIGRRI